MPVSNSKNVYTRRFSELVCHIGYILLVCSHVEWSYLWDECTEIHNLSKTWHSELGACQQKNSGESRMMLVSCNNKNNFEWWLYIYSLVWTHFVLMRSNKHTRKYYLFSCELRGLRDKIFPIIHCCSLKKSISYTASTHPLLFIFVAIALKVLCVCY